MQQAGAAATVSRSVYKVAASRAVYSALSAARLTVPAAVSTAVEVACAQPAKQNERDGGHLGAAGSPTFSRGGASPCMSV